ncbi:unnamed protein product [Paramecium pentaurelia]|uniref:Uncharacterized protein n=1 Tax=Paramecium pentaurelia TaxID=43138 RepID=A0A8S1VB41_9CILI|nr:unnamed protein product [Paramecium pentaurelia]
MLCYFKSIRIIRRENVINSKNDKLDYLAWIYLVKLLFKLFLQFKQFKLIQQSYCYINQFQKNRIQGYINYQQYKFEKRMKFSIHQTQFKSILIFIEKIYQICQIQLK